RPEAEGRYALPQHELGLDVIALVGALRYAEHRSIPAMHRQLLARGLSIRERTLTNLLDRYHELLAVSLTDHTRLRGELETRRQRRTERTRFRRDPRAFLSQLEEQLLRLALPT